MDLLLVILAGVLGFAMVAGVGLAFAGGGASERAAKRAQAIAERGRGERRAGGAAAQARNPAADAANRRKQIIRSLKEQERRQRKASVSLASRLQQAGLNIGVKPFWIACACIGAAVALAMVVLGQTPLLALGAGLVVGAGLPRWVVDFMAKRRCAKFSADFPDAADIIVRGIKTGLPVHDCLKVIARESPEPLGSEFQRLVENIGMGMSMDQALEKMYERMPTPELRFFAIVLSIQQKTGGNLAEALSNLSTVLRARKLMREKVKALSSEALASAFIIGALPPGVILLITITTPAYMAVMFSDPRGHMLLAGGALWMAVGVFVMRRMINFRI